MPEKRETVLKDCKGEEHQYVLQTWNYDTCMKWQEMLIELIAQPLVQLSMAAQATASEDGVEQAEASLAGVLEEIPKKIASLGLGKTCKEIMKGVRRSSKNADGEEISVPFSDNSMSFDCYTAGNSGELFQAVYWVLKENIFPFGLSDFLANLGLMAPSEEM